VSGVIYVEFTNTTAQTTIGAGAGAYGVGAWNAAANDSEWQAEQRAFLEMAAHADRESLTHD
jgi:hypothetical protein